MADRPAPAEPELIYLEPDDEITSLVRRVRAAEGASVVVVAPGRSRATSSAVALRLLAQIAEEEGKSLVLVADAGTRALAGEAGIPAFASVAEAAAGGAYVLAAPAPRAPIHVVRDVAPVSGASRVEPRRVAATTKASDDTVVTRLPAPARGVPGRTSGVHINMPRWPWLAVPLAVLLVIAAALLPGATVRITAATSAVGPKTYQLLLSIAGHQSGELHATAPGTATGQRPELVPATGTVTFFNRSIGRVDIPQGTHVSVGGTIVFATTKKITVPGGVFFGDPGQKDVDVVALVGGTTGNVAAGAIDTIDDPNLQYNRRVTNAQPTTGGLEVPHTVIQQSDVDTAVTAVKADLIGQLAGLLSGQTDRVFAAPSQIEDPVVDVPADLVGKEDTATFELTGTLSYDRSYVARTEVDTAARAKLLADTSAVPAGSTVVDGSINVTIGSVSAGSQMQIDVTVRARAAAAIDTGAVRDRIAGMTVAEAKAELADIGKVEVDLWPPWVDRLPRITFRISVETVPK